MLLKSSRLTKSQREDAVARVFDHSSPRVDFYLMLILSAIIVTLGLLIDSAGVVIGGMLIAPILSPILGFSMGVVVGNTKLIKRAGSIIVWSALTVVIISFIISSFTLNGEMTSEIFSRTSPSLAYLLIAMVSGAAVAYALVRPALSEILPGIAIAVALIPPLATVGISISFLEKDMVIGSFELFLVNLVGIVFAAVSVFSFMRIYEAKDVIERKLRGEEKIVQKFQKEHDMEKIEQIEKTVLEVKEMLNEKKKNG